jgi:hypothetical protein
MQVQISHEQLQSLHWPGWRAARQRVIDRRAPFGICTAADEREPVVLTRILMWPVIGLLVTGVWHFTIEAIWPDLQTIFVPAVLAPLLLAYGAWVGYRAVGLGAGFVMAVVAGGILGVLPLGLDIVGFGLVLDRGFDPGLLAGIFGMSFIVFGALIGAGVARSGMASQ